MDVSAWLEILNIYKLTLQQATCNQDFVLQHISSKWWWLSHYSRRADKIWTSNHAINTEHWSAKESTHLDAAFMYKSRSKKKG